MNAVKLGTDWYHALCASKEFRVIDSPVRGLSISRRANYWPEAKKPCPYCGRKG